MPFWKTKTFLSLAKEWDEKLVQSGFTDIEGKADWVINAYRKASELERESRLGYYQLLTHLTETTNFQSKLEQFVMQRHSDGATIKEIVIEIKNKGISRDRRTIRHIIRRWQMKWGIKSWTLHQMNLRKFTA